MLICCRPFNTDSKSASAHWQREISLGYSQFVRLNRLFGDTTFPQPSNHKLYTLLFPASAFHSVNVHLEFLAAAFHQEMIVAVTHSHRNVRTIRHVFQAVPVLRVCTAALRPHHCICKAGANDGKGLQVVRYVLHSVNHVERILFNDRKIPANLCAVNRSKPRVVR
jgi:hypothetical protein